MASIDQLAPPRRVIVPVPWLPIGIHHLRTRVARLEERVAAMARGEHISSKEFAMSTPVEDDDDLPVQKGYD